MDIITNPASCSNKDGTDQNLISTFLLLRNENRSSTRVNQDISLMILVASIQITSKTVRAQNVLTYLQLANIGQMISLCR
jgi:hypothetical protein